MFAANNLAPGFNNDRDITMEPLLFLSLLDLLKKELGIIRFASILVLGLISWQDREIRHPIDAVRPEQATFPFSSHLHASGTLARPPSFRRVKGGGEEVSKDDINWKLKVLPAELGVDCDEKPFTRDDSTIALADHRALIANLACLFNGVLRITLV